MHGLFADINNMFAHARQPRGHARTRTAPILKSNAGPGSHQKLVPRLARLAPTTGLNAALVRSLICLFIYGFVLAMTTKCCCFFHGNMFAYVFLPATAPKPDPAPKPDTAPNINGKQ